MAGVDRHPLNRLGLQDGSGQAIVLGHKQSFIVL